MLVDVRRFAFFLLACLVPAALGLPAAVADGAVSDERGFLPLAFAVSPPYFPVVRVDTITLPEVSESIGGVPDTADLYAPYLSKALRAQYKNKLPIVVVLQGANVDKEQYSVLGQRLARLGMIAVIPNSFRTFPFLGNVLFSDVQVLPRALAAVAEEAADKSSPIRGTPDFDAIGVVGHSLGGSAALYAAAEVCIGGLCEGCPNPAFGEQGQLCPELFTRPDGLKAVALYGTNLALPTPPGGVIPLPYDGGIPIAFLSGTLDSVSTPQETLDTYLSVVPPSGSPPTLRSLVSIVGTNHFGILKENNPEGAQPDLSEPDLPQLYGARLIAQTIAVWLRWHLQQDPLAEHWYTNVGASLDGTVVVDDLQ